MANETEGDRVWIETSKNGPLLVYNRPRLQDAEGNEIPIDKDVVALCRCGGSGNKPFCDGTHKKIGWSDDS